jgi:hypothetical protein
MRRLVLLFPLAFALAGCGGGGGNEKKSTDNPLVEAAQKTADAVSEATTTTATVRYPGRTLRFEGRGGYNHRTDEGWQHLQVVLPGVTGAMDEIFIKHALWMKSAELLGNDLPTGVEWLKYDVNKARKGSGPIFKTLLGQSAGDVLAQLRRTKPSVKTVGTETIHDVETTHYRAAIDPNKAPKTDRFQALTKAVYKPVDVWVDEDGLVRQVRLAYTTNIDPANDVRANVRLTIKLDDFGTTVDVEPPGADITVEATANSGQAAPG